MKAKDQSWRSMSGYRICDRDCFHAYDPICDEDLQEILFISECETQHIDTEWLEVKKKKKVFQASVRLAEKRAKKEMITSFRKLRNALAHSWG